MHVTASRFFKGKLTSAIQCFTNILLEGHEHLHRGNATFKQITLKFRTPYT